MEKGKGNLHQERFHTFKKESFYSENNHSLEQPQGLGHCRVSISGGFLYVTGLDKDAG